MTVLIFNLGLSLLLGYSLFAAITGKLNPLKKPDQLEQRPSWVIGLWASLVLTLVLCTGVHLTHGLPSGSSRELLYPGAMLTLFLVMPGFIFFVFYRHNVQQRLANSAHPGFDWADFPEELTHSRPPEDQTHNQHPHPDACAQSDGTSHEKSDNVTPAYLPRAELSSLNTDELPEPVNDSRQPLVKEHAETLHNHQPSEQTLREETEKNRGIARKALSRVESQPDRNNASVLIELEAKLHESIQARESLENEVVAEKSRSRLAESKLLTIKKDLVLAKREIRRSTAARAKALSTANKAIAFARQAIEVRAQLESEMLTAQNALRREHTTIDNLSRALEMEKQRTQQDIMSVAKQMLLTEKREGSSRSVEDIARDLETRLDPDYERTAALLSETNHGKAS